MKKESRRSFMNVILGKLSRHPSISLKSRRSFTNVILGISFLAAAAVIIVLFIISGEKEKAGESARAGSDSSNEATSGAGYSSPDGSKKSSAEAASLISGSGGKPKVKTGGAAGKPVANQTGSAPKPELKIRVIEDFEKREDTEAEEKRVLKRWSFRGDATGHVSGEKAGLSSGRWCLKLEFPSSRFWPALITENSELTGDWSEFDVLRFDVTNPSRESFWLGVAIADETGYSQGSKDLFSGGADILPGCHTVTIPLKGKKTKTGRKPDLSKIRMFNIFMDKPKKARTIYIDRIRLEQLRSHSKPARTVKPSSVLAFDFGPAGAPVFPGFNPVSAGTIYSKNRGYGWESRVRGESDNGRPDGIAGDYAGWNMEQVRNKPSTWTFNLDLDDGKYSVAVIARCPVPVIPWNVEANGIQIDGADISVVNALEYTCDNTNHDYPPGTDVFAEWVEKEYPVRTAEIDVVGGKLAVNFTGCAAYMLVTWPVGKNTEAERWMKQLREERRAEFYENFFNEIPPPPAARRPQPSPMDEKCGFIVYNTDYWKEIYTTTVPPEEKRAEKVRVTLAGNEAEPVSLAIHALENIDIELKVGDIEKSSGDGPDPAIEVRTVRFFPRRKIGSNSYRMVPMPLWPENRLHIPKGKTRQFWLTVRCPPGSKEPASRRGTIRIQAAGKQPRELALEINVLGFDLPASEELSRAYGWYYRSPDWRSENWRLGWFSGAVADKRIRDVTRMEIADMKVHGANCTQLIEPVFVGVRKNGTVELDFTPLDRQVDIMKELDFGLRHPNLFNILHLAGRLKTHARPPLKEFSPEFNKAYLDMVRQMKEWSEKREIPILFWLVDEPRESHLNSCNRNHADTLRYIKLIKQVSGIRTMVTVEGDKRGKVDYTDLARLLDVVQTHPAGQSKRIQEIAAGREQTELWFFNAGKNVNRYSFGVHVWARAAQGIFQWHYAYWSNPEDPLNNITGGTWGVKAMVHLTPDGVVPTLWYEFTREGIDDGRYLFELETRVNAAEKNGSDADKKTAAAAREWLEDLRRNAPEFLSDKLIVGKNEMAGDLPEINDLPVFRRKAIEWITALPSGR